MRLRRQIGINLRRARSAQKISQVNLAFEAEIAGNSMSNIERGEQNFTIDTLERLAKALGVAPVDLFAPIVPGQPMPKNLPRGKNVHHRGRNVKARRA